MIRGPKSLAGLIAYPVVPPSESPIDQTRKATGRAPIDPSPIWVLLSMISASGNIKNCKYQYKCSDDFTDQIGEVIPYCGLRGKCRKLQSGLRGAVKMIPVHQPHQEGPRHRTQYLCSDIRQHGCPGEFSRNGHGNRDGGIQGVHR